MFIINAVIQYVNRHLYGKQNLAVRVGTSLVCVHVHGEAYPMFININRVELRFARKRRREAVGASVSFVSFSAAKDSFPLSFRFSTHRNVPWPNNAAAKFIWESALLSYILDFSPQIYTSQYRGRS